MVDKGQIATLIAHVAERQHGHITRGQLLALGLSDQAVKYRVRTGELVRVHAGVYAVGYTRVEPVARAMAAVLACGDGAVVSHDSAPALWGLRRWPAIPEVITPGHIRRPNISTHRSRTLTREDRRVQLNVPTVSAARAIADIASRLTDKQLTRATQDARRSGHIKPTDLHRLLLRCPRLGQLVDPDQNPTRSSLEDTFVPWLREHGLPIPRLNAYVNGYEVDAFFEPEGLIVELDSWEYHRTRASWASDRERDAHHFSYGNPTIRIIPERLTDHEARRLRGMLERR